MFERVLSAAAGRRFLMDVYITVYQTTVSHPKREK
jgi:hypothetical protein